jgi:hypothetical protein
MISFHGLLDVIAGDFSKLSKPRNGFQLRPPRIHISRTKYSGEQLREIRARKGVGRPKAIMLARLKRQGIEFPIFGLQRLLSPLYYMETPDNSYTNYAEWERKPCRKPRGVAA